MEKAKYDVIIVGGSYAGLSAAMLLGRSLRKVLIIDSGDPCNKQTPHSHNFLTQDGEPPGQIADKAREQVLRYDTVKFFNGLATRGEKSGNGFTIITDKGESFHARKLIFATGISDQLPEVEGLAACWGISVIHCPYCHGYEVRGEKTGIPANGDTAFELAKMIHHWTKDMVLFTNGTSTLTAEQTERISRRGIPIIETEIARLEHEAGQLQQVVFTDDTTIQLKAIYIRPAFTQHCTIPLDLGCEQTEMGHLKVDGFQKTTVPGVFACGDNTHMMRTVSTAVATGTMAGAMANKEMIEEAFG